MFAIKVNITVCVIVRILMNPYMSVFKPLIQNSLARILNSIQTRQAGITGDYTFVTIYCSKCVTVFLNQMLDGIRLSKGSSVIF